MKKIEIDIAIIGGGIAGLWALNRLRKKGYSCLLFEAHALGAGQTLKSQGIIHGGLKYALQGILNPAEATIASMPNRWKMCLEGQGEIDLRAVQIASDAQYLWSTGSLSSEIMGFFAAKTLSSRVQKLSQSEFPELLKNAAFKGQVYRLSEVVLDTPSLIETLAKPCSDYIYKIDAENGIEVEVDPEKESQGSDPKQIAAILIKNGEKKLRVVAKRYLFTAGEGTSEILKNFKKAPQMQTRPLQMVLVKFESGSAAPFFAHCIDAGMNPRITITSHKTREGKMVWYLGGQLAEDGVKRSTTEQENFTRKELIKLFPWYDFSKVIIKSFFINRAESKQDNGKRPDSFSLENWGNALIAWPTKLALTPLLTDQILDTLQQANILPNENSNLQESLLKQAFSSWPHPELAQLPWEQEF